MYKKKSLRFSYFLLLIIMVSAPAACKRTEEETLLTQIQSESLVTDTLFVPSQTAEPLQQVTVTSEPPVATPTATSTPIPTTVLAYYHLMLELSTTSDWATLEFLDPRSILLVKPVKVNGTVTTANVNANLVTLLRPYEMIAKEPSVSMALEVFVDPGKIIEPLYILSKHGGVGGSGFVVSLSGTDSQEALAEVDHYWSDPQNPGYNDQVFEVDLSELHATAPSQKIIPLASTQKMLWAFYYPWIAWDLESGCTDHPVPAYEFMNDGSRKIGTFRKQIEMAQSAGIDGFIVSWMKNPVIDKNMGRLLQAAGELDFKIAIYLESTPNPGLREVIPRQIHDWLSFGIPQYGDMKAYMQFDGKPLVVVYNTSAAPLDTWRDIFSGLEEEGVQAAYMGMSYNQSELDVFMGLHQYSIIGMENLLVTFQSVAQGVHAYPLTMENPGQKIFAATVTPGFDDCPYHPPDTDTYLDRLDGEQYRANFEAAINSGADWIFITSWNEFGETTHIEPSESFGTQYLDITREYALRWKSMP